MARKDLELSMHPVESLVPPKVPLLGVVPAPYEGRQALDAPVVSCTLEEDKARQEYALTSSLAYQVQRFGVGVHAKYGVQDFDLMDLTTALQIVEESQAAWLRLPRAVRDRYQSWQNVEAAAASGELEQVLKAAGVDGVSLPSTPAAVGGDGGTTPVPPKEA